MPRKPTAQEIAWDDLRTEMRARADVVAGIDPELARALREAAADVGTEDERPGDAALLMLEPVAPPVPTLQGGYGGVEWHYA